MLFAAQRSKAIRPGANHLQKPGKEEGKYVSLLKKLVTFRTLVGYDVIDVAVQNAAEVIERCGA